jgi:hypothetical protein
MIEKYEKLDISIRLLMVESILLKGNDISKIRIRTYIYKSITSLREET